MKKLIKLLLFYSLVRLAIKFLPNEEKETWNWLSNMPISE